MSVGVLLCLCMRMCLGVSTHLIVSLAVQSAHHGPQRDIPTQANAGASWGPHSGYLALNQTSCYIIDASLMAQHPTGMHACMHATGYGVCWRLA